MKVNIFKDEEWEHIRKHNKAKTIKELVKSLYDNPCNVCRDFWLRLYAIKIGFLVSCAGNPYVLKKEVYNSI